MKYSKSDLEFMVDQIRKDKIIYAVESVAVSAVVIIAIILVGFIGGPLLSQPVGMGLVAGLGVIAIGYAIYMGVGNFMRLKRVKLLEPQWRKLQG